jgi:hypothetical protein
VNLDRYFGRAARGRRATAHHGKRHVFSRQTARRRRARLPKTLMTSRLACL